MDTYLIFAGIVLASIGFGIVVSSATKRPSLGLITSFSIAIALLMIFLMMSDIYSLLYQLVVLLAHAGAAPGTSI